MRRPMSALPSNAIPFTDQYVDLYPKIGKRSTKLIDEPLDYLMPARVLIG